MTLDQTITYYNIIVPYQIDYIDFFFLFAVSLAANALIRTTTSVSMIQGGTKINVLPNKVVASIDHRIVPTETVEGTYSY